MADKSQHSVLIIDDDSALRVALGVNFQAVGFNVLEAEDGPSALDKIREDSDIDVILCDLRMPSMNGAEILEQVREMRSNLPFIMISGYSATNVTDRALRGGAYTVLTKPVDPRALLTIVRRAVRLPIVLIIDEENSAIGATLAECHVTSRVVSSTAEALETLHNVDVDVIIADTNITGFETLHQLTKAAPEARLVVIFSGDTRELRRAAATARVFTYLQKPVPPEQLIQVVARARGAATM